MRKLNFFIVLVLVILTSCSNVLDNKVERVGLLIENTKDDQVWGQKGYLGLQMIHKDLDVNVYYKEQINSQRKASKAVTEFANKGVNLIYGHGSVFGEFFSQIKEHYPDIHFVYFNGSNYGENLTSLTFNSHAMGYFGGMVAGAMTSTNKVGIIAAYEWQPEIEGFFEGVLYENPNADVKIHYVNSWDDVERAMLVFNHFKEQGVDVYYPAGDAFNVPLLEEVKKHNLYAIGYISDQLHLGKETVLTSTVQHVDRLYLLSAQKFNEGKLPSSKLTFDFKERAISLGKFSQAVPRKIQNKVSEAVDFYIKTGKLPNERE